MHVCVMSTCYEIALQAPGGAHPCKKGPWHQANPAQHWPGQARNERQKCRTPVVL